VFVCVFFLRSFSLSFVLLAKRPAKENIEKFLQAEHTLHGAKLFTFLFGHKLSKSIEENSPFWFDTLASAFSGKKTNANMLYLLKVHRRSIDRH
jgi:hypothetical protein